MYDNIHLIINNKLKISFESFNKNIIETLPFTPINRLIYSKIEPINTWKNKVRIKYYNIVNNICFKVITGNTNKYNLDCSLSTNPNEIALKDIVLENIIINFNKNFDSPLDYFIYCIENNIEQDINGSCTIIINNNITLKNINCKFELKIIYFNKYYDLIWIPLLNIGNIFDKFIEIYLASKTFLENVDKDSTHNEEIEICNNIIYYYNQIVNSNNKLINKYKLYESASFLSRYLDKFNPNNII